MALVTGIVRRDAGRDGDGDAATQCGCVTGGAAHRGLRVSLVVLRVIEFRIKALVEFGGKSFERRMIGRQARMTDIAQRDFGRDELCKVAIGASLVSGQARRHVAVRARMA